MDRNKFDASLALADFRREVRDARIGRQWQASFALWALLAGAFLERRHIEPAVLVAFSVLAAAMHLAWLWWHSERAEKDQKIMFYYLDAAAEEAGLDAFRPERKPRTGLLDHPPALMQSGTTLLLVLGITAS